MTNVERELKDEAIQGIEDAIDALVEIVYSDYASDSEDFDEVKDLIIRLRGVVAKVDKGKK